MDATVFGNVDIGASPGELTLEGVIMASAASILMEIAGAAPADCDNLVLGDGVVFGSAGRCWRGAVGRRAFRKSHSAPCANVGGDE